MKRALLSTLTAFSLSLCALGAAQDWAEVQQLMEEKKPDEVLSLLAPLPDSSQRNFWMGRALLDQGRTSAAVPYLLQVPETDELYPYAAKALIYCAWAQDDQPMAKLLEPLCQSSDPKIAQLAKAAVLENELYHNRLPQDAEQVYQSLLHEQDDVNFAQALSLLKIDILRLMGRYEEAIRYGRALDANTDLPTSIRHRAKIQLAQVHYSQAKHLKQSEAANQAAATAQGGEDQHSSEDLRGQGEETLLQFISAHPDSSILDEAFFELYRHHAFESSNYLRPALESWIEPQELIHTKRAALALQGLYYIQSREGAEIPHSLSNMALTASPNEKASHELLLTTVRDTLKTGSQEQAEQYLQLLQSKGSYEQFLHAQLLAQKQDYQAALPIFLSCCEQTEGELLHAALNNAFICALHLQNNALAIQLLDRAEPDELKARLMSNRAAFYIKERPAQSAADARIICEQYAKTSYFIDAQLDLIQIALTQDINQAMTRFMRIDTSTREQWTDAQVRRYNSIRIKIALAAQKAHIANYLSPIEVIKLALESCTRPAVRSELIFQYSYYLSLEDRHEEAAKALLNYAKGEKETALKSLALLRAGIALKEVNSLNSLKQAISVFKDCANLASPNKAMASIYAAGILTRIGHADEARSILDPLDKKRTQLGAIEQCLMLSELANAWAASDEPTSDTALKTLGYSGQMTEIKGLSTRWQNRAHLQHAILASRLEHHEEAVAHFKKIIANFEQLAASNQRGDWYILNSAAMGAIVELLELRQYDEAKSTATQLAQLEGNPLRETYEKWCYYLDKARKVLGDGDINMLFL